MERVLADIRRELVERWGSNGVRVGLSVVADCGTTADMRRALATTGVRVPDEAFEVVEAGCTTAEGTFDIDRFMMALMGRLASSRITVVDAAWAQMCKAAEQPVTAGTVPVAVLQDYYDPSRHTAVVTNHATVQDAVAAFFADFNSETNPSGHVSRTEWQAFYAGVSLQIQGDTDFQRHVLRSWNLDKPTLTKPSRDADEPMAGTTTGQLGGRSHPLYRTAARDVGARLHEALPAGATHARPGAFTKNAPGFTAGTALNTATTRSRV